jgi:hypothetical protein
VAGQQRARSLAGGRRSAGSVERACRDQWGDSWPHGRRRCLARQGSNLEYARGRWRCGDRGRHICTVTHPSKTNLKGQPTAGGIREPGQARSAGGQLLLGRNHCRQQHCCPGESPVRAPHWSAASSPLAMPAESTSSQKGVRQAGWWRGWSVSQRPAEARQEAMSQQNQMSQLGHRQSATAERCHGRDSAGARQFR